MHKNLSIGVFSALLIFLALTNAAAAKDATLYLSFQSEKELRFTLKADANALLGLKKMPGTAKEGKEADAKTLSFEKKLAQLITLMPDAKCAMKKSIAALEHIGARGKHAPAILNLVIHGQFSCEKTLVGKVLESHLLKQYEGLKEMTIQLFNENGRLKKLLADKTSRVILRPPDQIAFAPPAN